MEVTQGLLQVLPEADRRGATQLGCSREHRPSSSSPFWYGLSSLRLKSNLRTLLPSAYPTGFSPLRWIFICTAVLLQVPPDLGTASADSDISSTLRTSTSSALLRWISHLDSPTSTLPSTALDIGFSVIIQWLYKHLCMCSVNMDCCVTSYVTLTVCFHSATAYSCFSCIYVDSYLCITVNVYSRVLLSDMMFMDPVHHVQYNIYALIIYGIYIYFSVFITLLLYI